MPEDLEPMLLSPVFQQSQQSQALLLPSQDDRVDTSAYSTEESQTDHHNEHGMTNNKGKELAFLIREAEVTCDLGEYSAPRKEDDAYIQWSFELFMLLFATAVFISIVLILNYYHDEVLPNWQTRRLTLNAVISILATIFRVTIAFIAFEILAQLKWEWLSICFRPLYHVELFDGASRGVCGSLRLLPIILRHEPFAVAAIAIAVLSLGIGSFTQQSTQTYQCLKPAPSNYSNASIRIANTVDAEDLTDDWMSGAKLISRMNLKTQVTIQDAIVNQVRDYHLAPLLKCSSGNCTFENSFSITQDDESKPFSHASIGVCNKCDDIYKLVRGPISTKAATGEFIPIFDLPLPTYPGWEGQSVQKGAWIVGTYKGLHRVMMTRTVENYTWALDVVKPEFLHLSEMSVANFTILTTSQSGCEPLDGGRNMSCRHDCENQGEGTFKAGDECLPGRQDSDYSLDPIAVTCTLYPCLRYYTATVKKTRFEEKVVQEVPLQLPGLGSLWGQDEWRTSGNEPLVASQQPCPVDGANMSRHSDTDQDAAKDTTNPINSTTPLECIFKMPKSIWVGLWNELSLALNSNCYSMRNGGVQCQVNRTQDEFDHPRNVIPSYPEHLAALYRNGTASFKSITQVFDSLATRLTTAIRLEGKRLEEDKLPMVKGELRENRICVRFVWKWLIFPGALLVSTAVLLVAIVVKDTLAKTGSIWKSSTLPLLLKDHLGRQSTGIDSLKEIAQGLEVKIEQEKRQ